MKAKVDLISNGGNKKKTQRQDVIYLPKTIPVLHYSKGNTIHR